MLLRYVRDPKAIPRFTQHYEPSRKTYFETGIVCDPSIKFASHTRCHPERSLARIARQTQSKDLRLFFNEPLNHYSFE